VLEAISSCTLDARLAIKRYQDKRHLSGWLSFAAKHRLYLHALGVCTWPILSSCLLTYSPACLPALQSRVHPKTQTPIVSVLFCGAISAVLALFVPLEELSDLTSMGALFAFCVVCAGVLFRCASYPPITICLQCISNWLASSLLLDPVGDVNPSLCVLTHHLCAS
jgi:hypothetical protein